MTRTQIYLPYDQISYLRQRALAENTSVSEIIRRVIEDSGPKKKTKINAGKWLLSLAKLGEQRKVKGPKDLATNLDKYLYGQNFC